MIWQPSAREADALPIELRARYGKVSTSCRFLVQPESCLPLTEEEFGTRGVDEVRSRIAAVQGQNSPN